MCSKLSAWLTLMGTKNKECTEECNEHILQISSCAYSPQYPVESAKTLKHIPNTCHGWHVGVFTLVTKSWDG
jgi:hypothetical protein